MLCNTVSTYVVSFLVGELIAGRNLTFNLQQPIELVGQVIKIPGIETD